MNGHTVQNQLGFVGLFGIDNDHAIVQFARKDIGALINDRDGTAGDLNGVGVARCGVSI